MREAVTKLGLEYNLMTQFTSFVAVEETVVTEGGKPRLIEVPVAMPHGMSYEASEHDGGEPHEGGERGLPRWLSQRT
jgi:Ca-activated chloride channel family protein